jgi:ribosome-associated toxin RatA of RatAB toxin-antitoxin module
VLSFRGGVARWTQQNRVTPGRIDFTQTDGDFQSYEGHWTATDGPDGCTVEFAVRYRTSVPHLAGAIESAAGRVLTRTGLAVLTGVCGPARVTRGHHFLQDLPEGSLPHAVR